MFSKSVLERVKIILSDGDSQEIQQIDNFIRIYFPKVFRGRCGWHIVDRGWHAKMLGKKSFAEKHWGFYDDMCRLIKNWMYTWMKSDCEA